MQVGIFSLKLQAMPTEGSDEPIKDSLETPYQSFMTKKYKFQTFIYHSKLYISRLYRDNIQNSMLLKMPSLQKITKGLYAFIIHIYSANLQYTSKIRINRTSDIINFKKYNSKSLLSLIKIYFSKQFYFSKRFIIPMNWMTRQARYLHVKQRLDSYNLPTTFPLQVLPLLSSLLERLDQSDSKYNQHLKQQVKTATSSPSQIQVSYKYVDKALRAQMYKIMHQNNSLHIQIISLKQELQSSKHCLDKILIEKSQNKEEIKQIINYRNQRESNLINQLQLAKYKYNELIDFINEEDSLERQYIKRLFNHKKLQIQPQEYEEPHLNNQIHQKDGIQNKVTIKDKRQGTSSKPKQSRKRINKTLEHRHHNDSHTLQQRLFFIQQKLKNRQAEIQRLHAVTSHEGPNLNKVLSQFNNQMQKNKISQIQERLSLLEVQNLNMKKQVDRARTTGGRYQALRQEVDKCHEIIDGLKEQNKRVNRSKKQNDFDIQKERRKMIRQTKKSNNKSLQMKVTKFQDDQRIEDLQKKVQFFQKQLKPATKQINTGKKKGSKKTVSLKSKLATKYNQSAPPQPQKNDLNNEQRQYEDVIKECQNQGEQQNSKNKRKAEGILKNNAIRQIEEESEQQDSSNTLQNHPSRLKKCQLAQDQPQRQESGNLGQRPEINNQTLVQQYRQAMSELTSKYLKIKQELQLRNQSYNGLEVIFNKLMKQHKLKPENSHLCVKQAQSHHQGQNQSQNTSNEVLKLKKQVQSLCSSLNQSEFQKQQLRREVIKLQQIYRGINQRNQRDIDQEHQANQKYHERLEKVQILLQQKQKKIQHGRNDQIQMEDRLLKAQDRIKRLNDEIELLTRQKQVMTAKLASQELRLDQRSRSQDQQRNSHTLQLVQAQKNEIIFLRKSLLNAQNKIIQLETYLSILKLQGQEHSYN